MADNPVIGAAKELRQRQTEAEKRLWFKLRDEQILGAKFRRQAPIGKYIVDFVNFEQKLVIELDGNPHKEKEIKINDLERTLWLHSEGFKVLRFWNSDVLNNLERVVNKVKSNLK